MDNEYITIKEFADISGVSVQSVYKKIKQENNPIKPYLKRFKNKLYIKRTALDTITPGEEHQKQKQNENPATKAEEKLVSILESQLSELREQLKFKDEQLREKDIQINQLLNQVSESMTLLNQQQQLTALTAKAPAELPEPGAKKSIWKRIFKKETPGD